MTHQYYKPLLSVQLYRQRVILREMTSDRSLCPVTHFMALAIADEALEGVDKPSRLHELRIQNSRNAQSIRIKPSMKDVPILRASNSKGAISNVEILTTDNALVMLKGLGQRAGYKENISLYAFRRGFANSIDRKYELAFYLPQLTVIYSSSHYCTETAGNGSFERTNLSRVHLKYCWLRYASPCNGNSA